jgi:transcriptional regulator GlxA family with amidase domain
VRIDDWTAATTVAEVAMQNGFLELGRFSHYYHSLFGEYPSETLGGRRLASRDRLIPRTVQNGLS